MDQTSSTDLVGFKSATNISLATQQFMSGYERPAPAIANLIGRQAYAWMAQKTLTGSDTGGAGGIAKWSGAYHVAALMDAQEAAAQGIALFPELQAQITPFLPI